MLKIVAPRVPFPRRLTIVTLLAVSSLLTSGTRALGDGHGGHSESGVASIDVYFDGQTIHLLEATRTKEGAVELHHRRSDDGGRSWPVAVRVGKGMPAPEGAHRGMDVQLAASGDRVVAAWQTRGTGAFGGGPMATAVSSDGGRSWRPGPNPADDGSTEGHGFIDIATDSEGVFHLVWLDSRSGAQGLRYARSSDGGLRWSANVSLDDETCECCWNSLAIAPGGLVAVLYRDKNPRDMGIVSSSDGGRSWTKPVRTGRFDWDIEACPHVGGGLVLERRGTSVTMHTAIWTGKGQEKGVYVLSSPDGGESWGAPKRLGDSRAWHPDLAAIRDRELAAVWDAHAEDGLAVFCSTSRDGGRSWTEPRRVSAAGMSASHPRVIATPDGFKALWTEKGVGKEAAWVLRKL